MKRIIVCIIAAVMAVSLAGCSGENDVTNTKNTEASQGISSEEKAAHGKNTEANLVDQTELPETEVETEPPKGSELGLTEQQLNSFSMLYYLAITAEEIRTSKDNRLMLEDIYTSLLNDINPGAIDDITQDHLQNLRNIIGSYIDISVKRDRLQFLYNQEKASAIRNAVPNPLAVLSMSNSVDWKGMAISAVYSIIDSYTNYKKASSAADLEFLKSGWELDDDETETIRKNRDRAFDYMVDMVQEYDLDGKLTLNEEQISEFAEICKIDSNQEKIRRLESENQTYKLLGNYWLELASCYFEASDYQKCLDAVDEYNKLATGIYRKDFNYVQVLPKAIVAAQQVYSGDKYVSRVGEFADELIDNTDTKEWSTRYFAAEVYLDLYGKTKDESYLNKAYNIAYDNVTILLNDQRTLNDTYLADVKKVSVDKPDYSFMTKDEKNKAEDDYEAEKKRAKSYYDGLVKARKTELPPVYEPLAVNCEMLFDLAQEKKISKKEQNEIEEILQTANNGIFLSKIVNNKYSFTKPETEYNAELTMRKFSVPADQLSEDAVVKATISENGEQMEIDDFVLNKVRRKGSTVDTFIAEYSSNKLFMHKWKKNSQVSVTINHGEGYEPVTYKFSISKFKAIGALPIVVEFDQE